MVKRRGRRRPQLRPRTVTKVKYRTRMANAVRRYRSKTSGLSGAKGHAVAIITGLGVGSSVSMATSVALGQSKPMWLSPVIAFLASLGTSKMTQRSWGKAIESGLSGAGMAYVQDRVVAGESIIPSLQSQTGLLPSMQVY